MGSGRHLIFFHRDSLNDMAKVAHNVAGISLPKTVEEAEFATASGEWKTADSFVVPSLGVAVSSVPAEQVQRLSTGSNPLIRYIREELVFKIAGSSADGLQVSPDYLRGYQAGINSLVSELLQNGKTIDDSSEILDASSFRDNADFTWGLQSIGLDISRLTGKNIKVAVLDTGLDFGHPDFKGRDIQSQSFIAGIPTAQDDNGHGTHCLGTIAGPKNPAEGPRYGVAEDAQLFVGKVMNADGKGNEGDILHGIGWALQNKCRVISLSLGKAVAKGEQPIKDYDEIGHIALQQNCIIIAAAGNDSARPSLISPVTIPANSSTIMAVGAIDRRLAIFNRSNGGINLNGGGVDLVGPGVEVRSSKPLPLRYGNDTGTSMATPHVSGIAALLMEADPTASAEEIWTRLTQTAKRLPLSSVDVGAGLVQIGA